MLKRPYEALGMTAHPFSFQSVCYYSLRMTEDSAAARRLKTQHNQDHDLQVGSCYCCSLHAFERNCFFFSLTLLIAVILHVLCVTET